MVTRWRYRDGEKEREKIEVLEKRFIKWVVGVEVRTPGYS